MRRGLLLQRRLAPDEIRFLEIDREAQARLERIVRVVDVVAVVAIALLHAQAGERLEPGMAQAERLARLDQTIVDVRRLLARNVKLVAQLAHVGDADAQHARVADVDLARRAERKRRVRQIGAGQRLQQLARLAAPAR